MTGKSTIFHEGFKKMIIKYQKIGLSNACNVRKSSQSAVKLFWSSDNKISKDRTRNSISNVCNAHKTAQSAVIFFFFGPGIKNDGYCNFAALPRSFASISPVSINRPTNVRMQSKIKKVPYVGCLFKVHEQRE